MSKLAERSVINRRTLYKVFDKESNPSFELVTQIMDQLGLSLDVKPKQKKIQIKKEEICLGDTKNRPFRSPFASAFLG